MRAWKLLENAKNDEKSQKHVFLLKIGTFQAQITQWKLDQNWTYYSVLESAECQQKYSGQKNVIF
jgi:hypothetical protein